VYKKTTDDLLLAQQIPAISGLTSITRNIGSVENKGIELAVGGHPLVGDLKWNTNVTYFRNISKVLDLGPGVTELFIRTNIGGGYGLGGDAGSGILYLVVDDQIGHMRGYGYEGVWSEGEAALAKKYGQMPGDPRYTDVNGDSAINTLDLKRIGYAQPKFQFGWNNQFSYKNFELSFLVQGVYGNSIFNMNRTATTRADGDFLIGVSPELLNRWTSENQDTDVPAFIPQTVRAAAALGPSRVISGAQARRISRFIEDGSYLRLKNITLAYNLPKSIIQRAGLKRLRVYATGANLLTLTNYSGYDPEVSSFNSNDGRNPQGDARQGLDLGSYPTSITYTFGIDLTF
jgi:TonB-dependent starch-binding outer membrane protein SusC